MQVITQGRIKTVTPSELRLLLQTAQDPILAGCLQQNDTFGEQFGVLEEIARLVHTTHTVCLLNPAYLAEFCRLYAIAGTPSYLLFYMGEEKTRYLGYADVISLMKLVTGKSGQYERSAFSQQCSGRI